MTNNRTQQSTYKLHVICEQRKPKAGIFSNLSGNCIGNRWQELSYQEMHRYRVE